jgi:two-component system, NtrC family, sensor kinase
MTDAAAALLEQYVSALARFLAGGDEEARSRAYELGRRAIADRLGLLEIAELHHAALETIVLRAPDRAAPQVAGAWEFLAEVLSSFEMTQRGYQETIARLAGLNESLERQNVLLAETARSEREAHDARKRAESQLIQSEKLAALGLLVAGVAHEINNPLAFVLSNMAVLERDARLLRQLCTLYRRGDGVLGEHAPELAREIADFDARIDGSYTIASLQENLHRSAEGLERIRQIVLDLREFARLEKAERTAVDLNRGVELTVRLIRSKAEQKGVSLAVELEPLPPVTCEGAKIDQVVLNLLSNAIDACGSGGRVEVRTRAAEGAALIEVKDSGSGIDPANRDKVFDPFFTTKPVGQGMGLGLAISHGIVEAQGGTIEFESALGQGTRFRVRLPLEPSARAAS